MFDPIEYEIDLDIEKYIGKYPKNDIVKARKEIYNDLHKEHAESLLELIAKQKCGILSADVVNFNLNGVKPSKNFILDMDFINPRYGFDFSSNISNIIETSEPMQLEIDENENRPEISKDILAPAVEKNQVLETWEILDSDKAIDLALETTEDQEAYKGTLKQTHLCEKKFCPRNLKISSLKHFDNARIVYVCDFCQHTVSIEGNMRKHLKEYDHYTASEYIIDMNQTNVTKICAIKSRSNVKNLATTGKKRVFCPACDQCFDTDTLACGMHYEFTHSGKGEYIYSVSEMKREEKMILEKRHSCVECKRKFKKLSDLVVHIDTSKHFPCAKADEINVYECPFQDCYFNSVYFFPFKTHILTHKYFNKPKTDLTEIYTEINFKVYAKPNNFMHISQYRSEERYLDKKEEIEAIDRLLDILKGHPDSNDKNKKLRHRKDQLHKSINSSPTKT